MSGCARSVSKKRVIELVSMAWGKFRKYGDSYVIRIPAILLKEKKFPFEENDIVLIEIVGNKLVVKKNEAEI